MFGVFAYGDCNKRGQTARPVAGAQIQTGRHSNKRVCNCDNSFCRRLSRVGGPGGEVRK